MWFTLPAAAESDRPFLPIEAVSWDVSVTGPLARVHVVERFRNTGRDPVDAVLVAPLGPGGSVVGLRMIVGTRVIEGSIQGRDEARAAYEAARDEGRTAALAEELRPDVFTLDVANLPPGEPVAVELTILEPVARRPDGWHLRLPTDAPPRLLPLGSAPVVPRIGADDRDVGVRGRVDVTIQAGVPLRALSGPAPDVLGSAGRLSLRELELGQEVTIDWLTARDRGAVGLLVSDTHALVAVEGADSGLDDAGCPLTDTVRLPADGRSWYVLGRRTGACTSVQVGGVVARAARAVDERALGVIWARAHLPGREAWGDHAAVRELGLTWGLVTSQTSLVAIDPQSPRPVERRSVGWAGDAGGAGGFGAKVELGYDRVDAAEETLVIDAPTRGHRSPARPAAPPPAAEPRAAERDDDGSDGLKRQSAKGVSDDARGERMFRLAGQYAARPDRAAWEEAARLYRAFATEYPSAERAAEGWFLLAELLRRLGRETEAEEALATLRARYPGSPYAR